MYYRCYALFAANLSYVNMQDSTHYSYTRDCTDVIPHWVGSQMIMEMWKEKPTFLWRTSATTMMERSQYV